MLNFLSLFAGIGGLDLGLERAGMRCVAQVEIDPFCRRILAKHWPDVPRFGDIREVNLGAILAVGPIDLIVGGFPCQDISSAGRKAGITGERSGLWSEFRRIIGEIRPEWVLLENVSALLQRGAGVVLGDLVAIGYDAEWDCIPAASFGAPHLRDRVFIVAHAESRRGIHAQVFRREDCPPDTEASAEGMALWPGEWRPAESRLGRVRMLPIDFNGGVDDGIPDRVDRLASLGNAVVPQVAEWIGRRIVAAAGCAHNRNAVARVEGTVTRG